MRDDDKDLDRDEDLDEDLDEDIDEDLDDEDLDDEDSDEDDQDPEDKKDKKDFTPEELKKQFLRERAMRKRAEDRLRQALKDKGETKAPAKTVKKEKEEDADKTEKASNELLNFRFDHPDLSTKDVEQVALFAQAKGVSMERAFNSPIVKTLVTRRLKKRRLLKASASSSGSKGNLRKNDIDWSALTPEEFRKAQEARRAARRTQ